MKTITYNPETHVLVPREPSEEMLDAAGSVAFAEEIKADYSAMLAAAPQPEPVESCDTCKNNGGTRGECQNESCAYEPKTKPVESEPVTIEEPNYHFEAMGCGLEDRNITDRYEAMQYGWECAISRMFEQIPDAPLYTTPQPGRVAELEAKVAESVKRLSEERDLWDRRFGDGADKLARLELELDDCLYVLEALWDKQNSKEVTERWAQILIRNKRDIGALSAEDTCQQSTG